PFWLAIENPRPDLGARQPLLCNGGISDLIKSKQRCAADEPPARALCQRIEPPGVVREAYPRCIRPGAVEQRAASDLDRRARDRPGPGDCGQRCDIGLATDHEAEPQSGEPV